MPTPASTPQIDLHYHLGNQCALLLLSDKGCYVWCDHPFRFQFADAADRGPSPMGGHRFLPGPRHPARGLRGGYGPALPAQRQAAAPINFTMPQYNTWIEFLHNPDQQRL